MILCLILLADSLSLSDSCAFDSLKFEQYKIPRIIDFLETGALDSILTPRLLVKPAIFLSGFDGVFCYTPYLICTRSFFIDVKGHEPFAFHINSHAIDDYFRRDLNLVTLPLNFFESIALVRKFTGLGINRIEFKTRVNTYERPYSHLYFTLLGERTIYNIDFTRSFNEYTGIYTSGFYSREYKNYDDSYLKTNGGFLNFYFSRFLPLKFDVLFTNASYDTIINNLNFSDIAITVGDKFYKLLLFRNNLKISAAINENNFITYGTAQKFLFHLKNFENNIDIIIKSSRFQTPYFDPFRNEIFEFNHNITSNFRQFIAGTDYRVYYDNKRIYFEPGLRFGYKIKDSLIISAQLLSFYRKPDYISRYGNSHFVDAVIRIMGNTDIKGEKVLHKSVNLGYKKSLITLYHATIKNQIVYQREGNNINYVVNIPENEIAWIEGFFDIPLLYNFSVMSGLNNILMVNIPEGFPEFIFKIGLNWQRETTRSFLNVFCRFNFLGERYDLTGDFYKPFHTISAGFTLRFLTLNLGFIFDNILDNGAEDFPDSSRNLGFEVKWEFWD
ncbi:MAG: hypothetical protein N3A65_05640 [candidate division WOR-3 bacterium]|nr:hypothetical protein [candidate division WOR-3 bacterium]